MNPEIAYELTIQRTSQIRAEAQRESIARKLRGTLRARRHAVGGEINPVIPDTVADLVGEVTAVPAQRCGSVTTTR
jgi:hypothetical protein